MKLISWNVNGLRAILKKDFINIFDNLNADIFCLQETKLQENQVDIDIPGYFKFWNYAEKKGYSGTAIFSKIEPISINYGIQIPELDTEGRCITLEFDKFYMVTVYTPNAQDKLKRIDFRIKWETNFLDYLLNLNKNKPVIICGDLNVAHNEIDLKNPKTNKNSPGFSPQEREQFNNLLNAGFIDTFRYLYPDKPDCYTWWSYKTKARERNAGWRIDYFCISESLKDNLKDAYIYNNIMGSDHCPVGINIDV